MVASPSNRSTPVVRSEPGRGTVTGMQVTIELDDQVRRHAERAAEQSGRTVVEVVTAWVAEGRNHYLRTQVPDVEIVDAVDHQFD